MNVFRDTVTEERFVVNLLAAHALVLVILVTSYILRRLLRRSSAQLGGVVTEDHWLRSVGREFAGHARVFLFWTTILSVVVATGVVVAYHFGGRDIRHDLRHIWYHWLLEDNVWLLGAAAGVAITVTVAWVLARLTRIGRPILQRTLETRLQSVLKDRKLENWFRLLERFVIASIWLVALWVSGELVGLSRQADLIIGFILRVTAIVVVARLLVLAFPIGRSVAMDFGNRHLGQGPFKNYWQQFTRLFPFGQRCFEAAVYVLAASLAVGELKFISFIEDFGPRVVECIGIFFATRVLIELLEVLLFEAFGLYKENQSLDAKGRTLVPLLHSLCQYVLYFGSFVIMLGVLGVDTRPILAGAGILGLAVGLGAQNLVTDVVSGFFILFESQYFVGDYVAIGDAHGSVEALGIRVTQIRDQHGKLHIIPNGQIKGVINYSKGYVNAVVDITVPRDRDLNAVFRCMNEAGKRLRQAHKQVLGDTEIHGIIELNTSDMKIRAVTKVEPGSYGKMESEYRRLLKEVFDTGLAKADERKLPALAA
jgi:small conductance mechanosensitive channel